MSTFCVNLITKHLRTVLTVGVLSFGLAACGGGGGSSTPAPTPTPSPSPAPAPTPAPTVEEAIATYLAQASDSLIIPRYQTLDTEADHFKSAAQSFCANSAASAADLTALQGDWAELNSAWQGIQWLKIGPIAHDNRAFRIQLWPDGNGAVARGVDTLLATSGVVTKQEVAAANVGAQGIPALEYLLWTSEEQNLLNAANKDKRCEVLQAISDNVKFVTRDVFLAWSTDGADFRQQFVSGTGEFTSQKDAFEEYVSDWLESNEIVKDNKVRLVLGNAAPGFPERAENYRSEQSGNSVKQNIAGFQMIYSLGDGFGIDDILTEAADQESIATQLNDTFTSLNATAANLQDSLRAESADEQGRERLAKLVTDLEQLRTLISVDVAQALDLNLGFNGNDGD